MSLIRPEAAAFLKKWREAIFGGVVLMFNIQLAATSFGLLRGLAFAGILIGAALFIEGVRRARLPDLSGGPGVVDVEERQITYFGPHGGGALSIDDLAQVMVRTTDLGPLASDFFWEFTNTAGDSLSIPGDAENASALFDVLTVLPGADYEAVIKASGSTGKAEFLVWDGAQSTSH